MPTPSTIQRDLGRLEGKLDLILTSMADMKKATENLKQSFDSLEAGRLSSLEKSFVTLEAQTTERLKTSKAWHQALISVATFIIGYLILWFLKVK